MKKTGLKLTDIKNNHYSTATRCTILMGSSVLGDYLGLIHEFFHIVEANYRSEHKLIQHVFREPYKKMWPDWYNGEGELFYYDFVFKNLIAKTGFERLDFKKNQDTTPAESVKILTESIKGVEASHLREIAAYKNQGSIFFRDKLYDKAMEHQSSFILSPDSLINNLICLWY